MPGAGDIFNSKAGVARVDDRGFASEFAVQAMKGTPAVALAAWTMNDVLTALGIAYVMLQGAYLVWRWRREARSKAGG